MKAGILVFLVIGCILAETPPGPPLSSVDRKTVLTSFMTNNNTTRNRPRFLILIMEHVILITVSSSCNITQNVMFRHVPLAKIQDVHDQKFWDEIIQKHIKNCKMDSFFQTDAVLEDEKS